MSEIFKPNPTKKPLLDFLFANIDRRLIRETIREDEVVVGIMEGAEKMGTTYTPEYDYAVYFGYPPGINDPVYVKAVNIPDMVSVLSSYFTAVRTGRNRLQSFISYVCVIDHSGANPNGGTWYMVDTNPLAGEGMVIQWGGKPEGLNAPWFDDPVAKLLKDTSGPNNSALKSQKGPAGDDTQYPYDVDLRLPVEGVEGAYHLKRIGVMALSIQEAADHALAEHPTAIVMRVELDTEFDIEDVKMFEVSYADDYGNAVTETIFAVSLSAAALAAEVMLKKDYRKTESDTHRISSIRQTN